MRSIQVRVNGGVPISGPPGPIGPQGPQGIEGPVGPKGDSGTPGGQGATGPQGAQGIQGETGPPGAGIELKGTVPTSAGLPAIGQPGDAWLAADSGDIWVWDVDTSAWINAGHLQGPQGPAGAQGPAGPQGTQGIAGPVGPQGLKGDTGARGAEGPQGLKGDQGLQGATGTQGIQGIQGTTGPAGTAGATGATGAKGDPGTTGPQGATGPQGTTGPQGPIGEQGVPGTGIELKGTVATSSALPATGAPGDAWLTADTGDIWVWDDDTDTWVNAGHLQGPQGPVGPQGIAGPQGTSGPQGIAGPQGATGAKGATGATGAAGATGATGAQGIKGDTGLQGLQGAAGAQGPAGPQGATGPQGSTGPQGTIGPQGPQGIKGDTGSTGPQGLKGDIGNTGPQGIKGDTGAAGSTGIQGPTGPQGIKGDTGLTGLQGPSGPAGQGIQIKGSVPAFANLPVSATPGDTWITTNTGDMWVWNTGTGWTNAGHIQGPQGATGATGATGAQGPAGAQGPTGATGAKGDTGTAGTPGATGATGPAGTTGAAGLQGPQGPAGTTGATGAQGPQGVTGPQGPAGASGVYDIQDEGLTLSRRAKLNFAGTGVTVTDDSANNRSIITIPGPTAATVTSVFGRTGAITAAAGDYSAVQVTNAVSQTGTYPNPAWITSLAWTKVSGAPSTFPPSTHQHAATDITTGLLASARMGTGTASSATFLRGDRVWAVPAGSTAVDFQTDGVHNPIQTALNLKSGANMLLTADTAGGVIIASNGGPYDVAAQATDKPAAGATLLLRTFPRPVAFPANFSGSYITAGTATTVTKTLAILKNGTQVGTITLPAGGGFSFSSTGGAAQSWAVGDTLRITAPAAQDASLADIAITLAGVWTPASSSQDVVRQIANDMVGLHEGNPHGVPSSFEWSTAPFVVMGNNPAGSNAMNYWFVVYVDLSGTIPANTRVNVRHCQLWWKRASTGVWVMGVNSDIPEAESYKEDYSGVATAADIRNEADGSISFRTVAGRNVHGFTPFPRIPIATADMGGTVALCEARLILHTAGGTDDRGSSKYMVESGADYYPETTGPGIENNPGCGGGKFKYVTNNWRSFAFTTLTEAQLRSNPPAISLPGIDP